ncbi:MAG: type VI secretion system tip protein VgrG [Deltaproteobacteria bacterium]|nr:type VI secretion system tip protein VgrG [Deltaproteobacteria bacterium]
MPILELSFACKEESLSVRRFSVHETLSGLFSVAVWARSPNEDIDLDAIVGKPAALRVASGLKHARVGERRWTGICSAVEQMQAETKGLSTYRLHIVPEIWLLTKRRGHRLFQHLAIPDIVDSVLGEWGIKPVWRDRPECPKLELRTQYGETDFAFVSRLLEEAGISYSTHKPVIHGVQSAVVVGPSGQEIYTDEFGRVRVQFHWDREGKRDDGSSCWMRVSQGWAGTAYGLVTVPRVGQEVLVAFFEGDPDEPVVVGRVFNHKSPVPYKLPRNKSISTWKSDSTPGSAGYNEIAFEDAKGKELVYIRAERDLDKLVKANEIERTQKSHHLTVGESQDIVVKKSKKELLLADSHLHVKGERKQKVDGAQSLTIGKDRDEKVGGKHALEAGREIHLKAGDKVVIEAGMQLTLKGPGGFVDIGPAGVTIKGTLVRINSGGTAGSGSGSSPKDPEDAQEAKIEEPGQGG